MCIEDKINVEDCLKLVGYANAILSFEQAYYEDLEHSHTRSADDLENIVFNADFREFYNSLSEDLKIIIQDTLDGKRKRITLKNLGSLRVM